MWFIKHERPKSGILQNIPQVNVSVVPFNYISQCILDMHDCMVMFYLLK